MIQSVKPFLELHFHGSGLLKRKTISIGLESTGTGRGWVNIWVRRHVSTEL